MCGIAGVVWREQPAEEAALHRAILTLRHRGPDAQHVFVDGPVGLAHARLSIIDLATGHQPMATPDGRLVVVFNGEIYNYCELQERLRQAGWEFRTASDTEVILAGYDRWGPACVEHFRGMFAFALYDRARREVFLARDRLGVKPLLYAETPAGLVFGSEFSALLELQPALRGELDWAGLADYFVRQYIQAPRTAYRAIRKLPPGATLTVREGRVVSGPNRYWFPERVAPRQISRAQAGEELRQLFTEATRLRLMSEVPLGAFLSGGVDSSITVATMARLLDRPFKTYCIGFTDQTLDERSHARRVAEHCHTEHLERAADCEQDLPALVTRLVRHFGEPYADSSMVPSYHVARCAREGLTVVLTGDGADEVWGGYKRHYHVDLLQWLTRRRLRAPWLALRKLTTRLEALGGRKRTFPVNQLDQLLASGTSATTFFSCKLDSAAREKLLVHPDLLAASRGHAFAGEVPPNPEWDPVTQFLFYDMQAFLAGDALVKVDITTMMNSLEARSPFLDHRLVELALSLPNDVKRQPLREGKRLLKEAFADLVPAGHFDRPKMGFSPPLPAWLRTHLREWCGDLLHSRTCAAYLNPQRVHGLFEAHQQGQNHTKELWLAAIFCEWARQQEHPA